MARTSQVGLENRSVFYASVYAHASVHIVNEMGVTLEVEGKIEKIRDAIQIVRRFVDNKVREATGKFPGKIVVGIESLHYDGISNATWIEARVMVIYSEQTVGGPGAFVVAPKFYSLKEGEEQ